MGRDCDRKPFTIVLILEELFGPVLSRTSFNGESDTEVDRRSSAEIYSATKSKMNRATAVLTAILLLCAIAAQGIPIPGTQGRCLCPENPSSNFIHPRTIQSLQYIPKGSYCEKQEIIITMKTGKIVCVSPDAKWVKIIIGSRKGSRRHN
ncbi:interleukin-8-like [Chiloscyllium punctatum]|uniref:interleukin-8-like n=1 Tax=Chiloscyllium punctatum TaxID=137246 RepID=UPI003B63B031